MLVLKLVVDSFVYFGDYAASNYPFIGKASKMLGDIPAPPAYAAESPVKGAALHFASAQEASS